MGTDSNGDDDMGKTMEQRIEERVRESLLQQVMDLNAEEIADLIWDHMDTVARNEARDTAQEELEDEDTERAREAEREMLQKHIIGMSLVQITESFRASQEDQSDETFRATLAHFQKLTTPQIAAFLQSNMEDRSSLVG